jgi:hypothetical protein
MILMTLAAHLTLLESIVWHLMNLAIGYVQHSFHTDGLRLWCKLPHRVFDAAHPSRLLSVKCYVNGITGMAHPAGKG